MDKELLSLKVKVGLFSALGILLIIGLSFYINNRPFWWRVCQPVFINIQDATGLKTKSPVRSLGLQIGFLKSVELYETHVRLGICITAPVEVLPDTKASIRGEGFLGDKFVELKPVRYKGKQESEKKEPQSKNQKKESSEPIYIKVSSLFKFQKWVNFAVKNSPLFFLHTQSAFAEPSKEIPVETKSEDIQAVVNKVNLLVEEVSGLAKNINSAINPDEMKKTLTQLNLALENATKTLSPEGNLTTTAQRTLYKLEDAIEQLRQVMTRVNQGEGALGKLLSDPEFAEDIHLVVKNANKLLNRVSGIRLVVDLGADQIPVYDGARGFFNLQIIPKETHYYLLGVSVDPAGKITTSKTITSVGGISSTVETSQVEQSGILITAMLGGLPHRRFDFSAGVLYGDGAIGFRTYLGPNNDHEQIQLSNFLYSKTGISGKSSIHYRGYLKVFPLRAPLFRNIYLKGGIESFKKVDGKLPWFVGAGVSFDDEEIKLLFTFI